MKIATIQTDDGFRSGIVTDSGGSASLELYETAADLRYLISRGEFDKAKRAQPIPFDPIVFFLRFRIRVNSCALPATIGNTSSRADSLRRKQMTLSRPRSF